ncbi:MAG TPA: prolipoprotein diacylglyceryl transferase [Candidatus Cloacimonadota bacterium]|nr:prolipoprotein diacylglyceryl transferase [Candidatus Cloacimonadota bacterium]
MLHFPNINPTILHIGLLEIRWYGLFYILAFAIGYLFIRRNYAIKNIKLDKEEYESLLFDLMLGVIIGGRIGYVLFYNLSFYLQNPLQIFKVWEGGMSFHGGAIGVIIAGLLFCRKHKHNFYKLADPVMPLVSVGLFFGRIGNFINAELYGRPTNVPWGMIFPNSDGKPRHPSQLYEAFAEGILLFLITNFMFRRVKTKGIVFWSWIGLYGLFRFLLEFMREPDVHLGYIWGFMTTGQILCSLMVISSIIAIVLLLNRKNETAKA